MPGVLEFTIFFPAPPQVFVFLLAVLTVLLVYWIAKWIVSLWTGA